MTPTKRKYGSEVIEPPLTINEDSGAIYNSKGEWIGCLAYPEDVPEGYTVHFRGPVTWDVT